MQTKKHYFNPALFWADLRRYSPIWVCATLVLMLLPFSLWLEIGSYPIGMAGFDQSNVVQINKALLEMTAYFAPVATLLYAVIPAMALLHYLYQARSCLGTHALPISRPVLFLTHYLAGLAMMGLPLLILCVTLTPLLLYAGAFFPLLLLTCALLTMGMYTFFFSFALLCGTFTGQLWGLPVFYAIFNFVTFCTTFAVEMLANRYLFGYFSNLSDALFVQALTPVWGMLQCFGPIRVSSDGSFGLGNVQVIVGYTLAGLCLAALALFLYCKRHLEQAGEIVTLRILRPLFVGCLGVYTGFLTMLLCGEIFDVSAAPTLFIFLTIGVMLGVCAARMLLEKTIAIWNATTLRQGGAVLAASIFMFAGLYFDLFGYGSYLPEVADVASVSVYVDLYADDIDLGAYDTHYVVKDAQGITQLTNAHAALVREGNHNQGDTNRYFYPTAELTQDNIIDVGTPNAYLYATRTSSMRFTYTLNSGRKVTRRYYLMVSEAEIARTGSPASYLEEFANGMDLVALIDHARDAYGVEIYARESGNALQGDEGSRLAGDVIDAMIADIEENGTKASLLEKRYMQDSTCTVTLYADERATQDKYFYIWAAPRPGTVTEQLILDKVDG